MLSTCNRAELYVACDDRGTRATTRASFISEFHGVEPGAIRPHVYDVADLDAARHLFRVAAGLDSLVVGEPQILGQVKEAHTAAPSGARVGPLLNRLFHCVVRRRQARAHGNRARLEGAVSVSFAAVALAREDLRRSRRAATSSSSAPARWASSRRCT